MTRVRQVQDEEQEEQEAFMGSVQDSEYANPWSVTLLVNGKPLDFKIDTGADVTVIPKDVYESIPGAQLTQAKKTLSGPSHTILPVKGQFVATLKKGNQEVREDIFVVRRLRKALLGRPAIESLGLLCRVNMVLSKSDLRQHFPEMIKGLGKLKGRVPDSTSYERPTIYPHHSSQSGYPYPSQSERGTRAYGEIGSH